jgi:RNA polymerase sigma-70 factor (ECF subfamily)
MSPCVIERWPGFSRSERTYHYKTKPLQSSILDRMISVMYLYVMGEPQTGDVTRLLLNWKSGNRDALDQLIPIVYQELHALALRYLKLERSDHTLQPTALIHEAYLRLVRQKVPEWTSRAHFFGVATHIMREILVDYARKRSAEKRGGGMKKVTLDDAVLFSQDHFQSLLRLDQALAELGKLDERKSRVIELRYFGGLGAEETAEALGISVRTVTRDLRVAEAWLRQELSR